MRHALKRIHLKWQTFRDWARDIAWSGVTRLVTLSRRQRLAFGGFGLALFGIGFGMSVAWAQDMGAFSNIGGAIGSYVMLMAAMMVMAAVLLELVICVLLTKLLIAVCSYQGFVTSDAVVTGWPLVRDLCNMFFIVVLLIIAFSTIIGYKEFDYKRYVPRLLLMAVLINFSKTLVGLLIDFSQVIMLTFVNGFKEAAFGNFVKAFGLDKVLSISDELTAGHGTEAMADTLGLLISLLFATIMLMVVATILTMMLVYMTARIVTLWVLLIFSPLAFFIWALPPKLAKTVQQFSSQWWSNLGSWLSGGPILAFFLWLTMAIVAAKPNPFASLMPVDPEMSAPMKLLSRAAETGNVANFVVATALLFIGLKQALEISKQAGGLAGAAMQKVGASGGPIGAGAVLGARVAGKGASLAGRAAGKGVKLADQKLNVSGKLGKGIMEKAGAWGREGGLKGMLASPLAAAGAKIGGIGTQRERAAAEKLGGTTKFLPPEQYDNAIQAAKSSHDKDTRAAAKKDEMLHRFDPGYRETLVKRRKQAEMEGLQRDNPGMAADELDRQATLRANRAYDTETGTMLTSLQTDADVGEDGEFRKKLREQMASNPQLSPDLKTMRADMQKKKLHEIPAAAYTSMDVGIEAYRNNGLIGPDNRPVSGWEAKAEEMAKKLNPEARERFMAVGHALQTTTGQAALTANASNQLSNSRMDRQTDGSFVVTDAAGGVTASFGGAKERRSADIRQAISQASGSAPAGALSGPALDRFSSQFSQPPTQDQQRALTNAFASGAYAPTTYGATPQAIGTAGVEAMGRAQSAGVPASVAFQFDGSGNHQSPAYREAHQAAATTAISGASSDPATAVSFVMNMDTGAIAQGGEVAGVVAQAMKGRVAEVVKAATAQGPTSEARVKAVLQAVEKAMSEAQGKVAGGVATPDQQALADLTPDMSDKAVKKFLSEKKKKT